MQNIEKRSLVATFPKKPDVKKTSIFWEKKKHGLTLLQIFEFLDVSQTLLFRPEKHSFPSRISQNYLLWLDIPKNHIWEKGRFFCQKPWANRFAKFRFVWFFSNFIIPVQETFFILLRVSKNVLLWLHIAKNHTWKKVDFWQKPWTNPFANFLFFGLFSNFSIPV